MSERVYKLIEITGSSLTSLEDAIQTAVAKAAQTIRNMRWFEVIETRGTIKDGEVEYWQVTIKVGFTLDDDADM
jgi:flavin-binding protein dodecin